MAMGWEAQDGAGAEQGGMTAVSCRLVQLDIDSHLAQCLAESAEDVLW